MTLEEFKKKAEDISDWVPGRDAIEEVFSKLYPDFVTDLNRTKSYLF